MKTATIGMLVFLLAFSLACANPGVPSNAVPAGAPSPPPITFKVSNLTVNPPEVNAGVQALITAQVTNTGASTDSYLGKVRIANAGESSLPSFIFPDEVAIPPGETKLLSVVTAIAYPGTYEITWGGETRDLTVVPSAPGQTEPAPDPSGGKAPNFVGKDIVTGKTVSLRKYTGSAVLLNFVNYGCSDQLNKIVGAQLLAIRELYNQRDDFVPISVFCGCCPPDILRQFARDNNLNWPWILDSDYSIADSYASYLGQYGYPTLIFIGRDGVINEVTGYAGISTLANKINRIAPRVSS